MISATLFIGTNFSDIWLKKHHSLPWSNALENVVGKSSTFFPVPGATNQNYEERLIHLPLSFFWQCRVTLNYIILRVHYSDVTRSPMASQITGVSILCRTACLGTVQRKPQSSASLTFVRGILRSPVDSSHKQQVTQKMFPFDDVTMLWNWDGAYVILSLLCPRVDEFQLISWW